MADPPTLIVLDAAPRRSVGRPRAAEPRSTISVRILERHHDLICQAARASGTTVSAFVRGALARAVAPPKSSR